MEQLSYSTAGQPGPTAVYAPPYATAPSPLGPGGPPPPPSAAAAQAPMTGMLPYGVEIPNRVFVGGCPFSMTDKQLGEVFAKYGTVKDSKIIADRGTGKSKGYGFVTFATEEEAMNVHAMGSIFYNEKKLNLARAIRKCGGQFNRANQEYVNGQRAVYVHPNGYLIQQFEGNWHFEQFSPHAQPVKPCYPMYYPPPPPAVQHQPYYVNSGGFSPVGGTTFFPQSQPAYTSISNPPPPPNDSTAENYKESVNLEEEKEATSSPPSSPPSEKKDSSTSDQLVEQVKQLSLDSAYTSEADLEHSCSSSVSPQEGPSTPQEVECSGDEKVSADHNEPPPDISKIVVRRSPPSVLRSSQARLPKYTPTHHYANNNGLYYGPGYIPGPYAYPYTPQAAIQTIGPMYHNQ